jgi:hypothetical protein
MDKKTKKEYLKMLHEDKFFNHALSLSNNEEEKRKIRAFAEDVFINLLQGTLTSQKIIKEHPEKLVDVAEGRISKDKEPTIVKDK